MNTPLSLQVSEQRAAVGRTVVAYRLVMLYAFGFDRIGVVVGDLYLVDPDPLPGQDGPEQGVRVELRLLERPPLQGGIYSARPVAVGRPLWRADLLEAVDNPGSLDRAHHHPTFAGWNPCPREFVAELAADPVGWVGRRLSDLDGLLEGAAVGPGGVGPTDADHLRGAVPEILDAVHRLLARVRDGDLVPADVADGAGADGAGVRAGWL
jgi:hypothetical protein